MNPSGRGKVPKNPWNTAKPSSKLKPNPSERKFREAQVKLKAAVDKFAKDYESSSSEDDLESDNLIGGILKNYSQSGGQREHLGRTQAFLEDTLASGVATCLICIGSIKRVEKIWSCISCYCFFHLQCIERWSKDSVTQQKESLREQPQYEKAVEVKWGCPKCRFDYLPDEIPRVYRCFCGKVQDPPFEPWIVPHSCGETCGKQLKPVCGHECVLLCHPGPCPPCPKTVTVACYCKAKPPKIQRCSNKDWSCGAPCHKLLGCKKHPCPKPCHAGNCPPCAKRSTQKCLCGAQEQQRDCASPVWQCQKICGRDLLCGHHRCLLVCHAGPCSVCPLSKPRQCPCGGSQVELPCTEETPTCGDTCGKLLECGAHTCSSRCHKDKCGMCLEIVVKRCRCGLHEKEVQCKKQYLCDTKCKKLRDCNKHPCNRKCCDGNCPPCEKPCGHTLTCGLHKCPSVCHRGPCYPCTLTTPVKCRCGATVLTVPCGRKKRTRPPRCNKPCRIPADCHHPSRTPHRCHFGDCPPCRQICAQKQVNCDHLCPALCHSAVMCKVEVEKATMPWEQRSAGMEKRCLPCEPCQVPVSVTCLGGHETCEWPCIRAQPRSCNRSCGRTLACGNHTCGLECHTVLNAPDNQLAGTNCEQCELPCMAPRLEGCQHECPKPCHPGPCPPCTQILRLRCHCGLNLPYERCSKWTSTEDKDGILSCGNQCPKNYECGHRCKANCHPGLCPNPELCNKKMKVTCKCKRIRREFQCIAVRNNEAQVDCDELCVEKKLEEQYLKDSEAEVRQKEEDARNAKELELFQKKFGGKKKYKDRKRVDVEDKTFLQKYRMYIVAFLVVLITICFYTFV